MRTLRLALLLVCLSAALLPASAAEPPERRPNVLWIIADDHAAHALGTYGNTIVRTPNLDRLATAGVRFDRAYCNAPVCTASRQSFLTGRYPRTLGVTQLQTALPAEQVTLAHRLKEAGYATAAIGKMHFNSNHPHGFDLRLDLREHAAYLKEKRRKPILEGVEVQPPWRPFKDPARVWLNSRTLPLAMDEDMPDTWLTSKAVEYLGEKHDRPFFLMASLYEPHSPFHFPVEFRGRIKPEAIAVPKVGPEDDDQIPAIFRDLNEREKQGIAAAYYTAVEHLDRNVGRILRALDESGQAANTLVVYIGDHGYMLGQHGRFEKHCCYEPAVRAPLLVRFPGRVKASRSSRTLVEFVDLAPTLLETCGVAVPKELQGRSLWPVLSGSTDKHRDFVISEYSENEEAMIRSERWKLVYGTGKRLRQDGYATGRPLSGRTVKLFDEENDPQELVNLSERPEQAVRVKHMTAQLAEDMVRTARQPELVPRSDDVHVILEHCLQPRDVKKER